MHCRPREGFDFPLGLHLCPWSQIRCRHIRHRFCGRWSHRRHCRSCLPPLSPASPHLCRSMPPTSWRCHRTHCNRRESVYCNSLSCSFKNYTTTASLAALLRCCMASSKRKMMSLWPLLSYIVHLLIACTMYDGNVWPSCHLNSTRPPPLG